MRLKCGVAAAFLYCGLASGPLLAQMAAATSEAPQPEAMVLAVTLNTQDKGQLFVNRTADGDFLVKTSDLTAMGFTSPVGTSTVLDGELHISLRSMQGLAFSFREKVLALDITADPRLLPTNAIDMGARRRPLSMGTPENSSFFNYAINYTAGNGTTRSETDFAGEFGARHGEYLLLANGNTVRTPDGRQKFVRLMSSVARDDRDTLQRFVAGDFFASSRDLGNGANLGGISIAKLYAMDPYQIRYPLQSIRGQAALPSDLEVYVDGQKIRSERLQPGSFELRDLLSYGGSRSVQVLVRDPFGRVQQIEYPFYFSDQPLAKGLHEYNYGLGALRRNFGTESNRYGPLAFSMFHRYGFSDALSLGVRGEGRRSLYNGGPFATLVLGNAGVLNLSVAASDIEGTRGLAGLAGYSFQSPSWSLGASLRGDSRRYVALTDPVTIGNRKYEGNASVAYNLQGSGVVSLSHSTLLTHSGQAASFPSSTQPYAVQLLQNRRETTLSYSTPIMAGKANLVANLSHIKESMSSNELFVGINIYLGNGQTFVTNFQQTGNSRVESLQFNRAQPIGEGLGYDVSADQAHGPDGERLQLKMATQYNAPAAVLRAEYAELRDRGQSSSTAGTHRLSVSGGAAYVGGNIALGRPVTDSFGFVKIGELQGVPVTLNGQDMGKTNSQGRLFIPSLPSYYDNQVVIAPENIPMDYAVGTTVKRISPPMRSGVLLDFEVIKIRAATGKLQYAQEDATRPVEFREISLHANGKAVKLATGRGGEFYVENLAAGTYPAVVELENRPCIFDLVIPKSDETFIELGAVTCAPAR